MEQLPSHHRSGGGSLRASLVSVVLVPVCLVNNFLRDNFLTPASVQITRC